MDKLTLVFGTIFAAFIAGLFSLFTLINNKEQKVSEFRQAWIDGLRKDISEMIASLYYIAYYVSTRNKENKPEPKDIESSHKQYVASCASILTRINALDPDKKLNEINNTFLNALDEVQNEFNKNEYSYAADLTKKVLDASKPLLKEEWERVKAGEKAYRKTKLFAWIILLFGLILAVLFLVVNIKFFI